MQAAQHLHLKGPLNFTNLKEPFILWVNFANNATVIRFHMLENMFFFSCCSTFYQTDGTQYSVLLLAVIKHVLTAGRQRALALLFQLWPPGAPLYFYSSLGWTCWPWAHWCISLNINSWKWLFQMRAIVVIVASALLFIMGLWPHKMAGKLHCCMMAV